MSMHRAKLTDSEVELESDSDGERALSSAYDETSDDLWLIDSGVSSHMTPKREYFVTYRSFSTPEEVSLDDGTRV